MPDEDLTDYIDVDTLARLLATPAFDVEACRERIASYVRLGDGDAGRGIGKICEAFKTHAGEQLTERKPSLIATLAFTKRGVFSPEVGHRTYACLGHPIWHHYHSTRLLDANPFAIAGLIRSLHAHAGDDIDRVGRDLVSWVELADAAARDRLAPVVARAGDLELDDPGYTPEIGGRMFEVITLAAPTLEAKLERVLANTAAQISHGGHLQSLAPFIAAHDSIDAPAWESSVYTNDSDRAYARAAFEVFWYLTRRHRELFDRVFTTVFARNLNQDDALQLLGIVDEATELERVGARGERWRIMRAGRLVMTTTGESLTYLPRFTVSVASSEVAARKSYAKKLEAKRVATPPKPKPKKR